MENPFIYGAVVTGDKFANRKKEHAELVRDLTNYEKIFLISPRRYGKTSLIINAFEKIDKRNFYTIYIDFYRVISLHKLLEIYAREIARVCESKLERAVNFLRETIPQLRPKITIEPDGSTNIGLEYVPSEKDIYLNLEEIFELPEKIAQKKGKGFVIAFDEFQEVNKFNGEAVEKLMRSIFQRHKKVGYLFAGSKKHLIYEMISNRSRPFYKLGRIMTMDKMPREDFGNFLKNEFIKTKFELDPNVFDRIFSYTKDVPYNTQYLCHRLWDLNRDAKKIKETDVEIALDTIITEETPIYSSLWDSLSLHQRQVLYAIAHSGSERIFSRDYIAKNNLGALATVQTSLRLLVNKEVLEKEGNSHSFTDVFFEAWVRRRI